jgi:hypothetical protein
MRKQSETDLVSLRFASKRNNFKAKPAHPKRTFFGSSGPGAQQPELEPDAVPFIKKDKIMLKRLEIRSTKSKIGVTDLTWVNEEVKDIEKEDEKSLVVNEIALMIPYLNR